MGMYTGLKGTIKIKEEVIENFSEFINGDLDIGWEGILPEGHGWLNYRRNSFIPFGSLCYMPHSWEEVKMNLDKETREFTFACSLKNYEGEIRYFIENVLPIIGLSWELEELYEEDEEPVLHIYREEDFF